MEEREEGKVVVHLFFFIIYYIQVAYNISSIPHYPYYAHKDLPTELLLIPCAIRHGAALAVGSPRTSSSSLRSMTM